MHHLREKLNLLNEIQKELSHTIDAIKEEINSLTKQKKTFKNSYKNEIEKLKMILSEKICESSLIIEELRQIIFIDDYL